ncbi:MAG: NF038130 family PEP-CTERM protein [Leptolyngbyaceae cyanobacterium]
MIIAVKKLALGLPVLAGVTVGVVAPASAVTFSTSGSTIEFCSNGSNTYSEGCTDDLGTILSGNSATPGGNVELGGNVTDGVSLGGFIVTPTSSLTADFGDDTVTFSSLTANDWLNDGNGLNTSYGADNLANQWFGDALAAYGTQIRTVAAGALGTSLAEQLAFVNGAKDADIFSAFLAGDPTQGIGTGLGYFSDPNVSYVNEGDGEYVFGLAGHLDAGGRFPLFAGLTASEVVKVTYGGESEYYYSFGEATDSGQVAEDDGASHNGNFEFRFAKADSGGDLLSESVPEPASILGLVAVSGLVAARKRAQQ